MKLSIKETQILSVAIACFGIFMTTSGIIMNKTDKPIIKTVNTAWLINFKQSYKAIALWCFISFALKNSDLLSNLFISKFKLSHILITSIPLINSTIVPSISDL